MKKINSTTIRKTDRPIKFLQFGEGNFLRAFIEWMIQKANNEIDLNFGGVIVQPLNFGMVDKLNEQDDLYHIILEGIKNGEPIREIQQIDCIQDAVNPYAEYQKYKEYFLLPDLEFVFSNTTEAGITKVDDEDITAKPPASFPGKVVALLNERFKKYEGDTTKGLTFICCELIENNASTLKKIVLELASENSLGDEFAAWINNSCTFCNTLVDRIVTGFPKDKINEIQQELGYEDNMVVTAEYFHLWAIEGDDKTKEKLPLHKARLNVLWLEDLKPFRDKKVRVLNGAHTALVPVGLLAGYQTVKEAFGNTSIETFIRDLISKEVLPNIAGNQDELSAFANEILDRFLNPYIKHYMKDISLNSLSKWITRDFPSLKDSYERTKKLPERLVLSLAALLQLYVGKNDIEFEANDTNPHLPWLKEIWNTDIELEEKVSKALANKDIWEVDFSQFEGIVASIANYIEAINNEGILSVIKKMEN